MFFLANLFVWFYVVAICTYGSMLFGVS